MRFVREQESCHSPLVSVAMITYNHEAFIAQAVESVLAQRTDFEVELVIGEDCSTDRTREIVERLSREFPGAIRPVLHRENVGPQRNARAVLQHCRGEYVAVLEGDDYWNHEDKLSKQRAFLEQHPRHSMCFHPVRVLQDGGEHVYPEPDARGQERDARELILHGNVVPTCSVLVRKRLLARLPDGFDALKMGDWPTWILTALNGPIGCVDEVMACYRIHQGGVWSGSSVAWRIATEEKMWALLLPHLTPELQIPARERLNTCYLQQLAYEREAHPSAIRRWAMASKWFVSSLRLRCVRRNELRFVLGRLLQRS